MLVTSFLGVPLVIRSRPQPPMQRENPLSPIWFQPGPNFGYTIKKIADHPWNTLITMKEVFQLDPGSLLFTGPSCDDHTVYWKEKHPELFEGKAPLFELDTTPIHPHEVETAPRRPFQPYSDL